MRISAPTYTQTPNDLVDYWLPHLKEVELKVLLVIMRKTFGWHKIRDRISLSQLEKLTGSDRKNIIKAVDGLVEKGLVKKEVEGEIGTQKTYYELIIHEDSNNSYQCQITTPPSGELPPPPSGNLPHTKETLSKEKQQNKVVVVKGENSPAEKKENSFTKDDLLMNCVRLQKDWTTHEMEKAWTIYENSSYPVSNPLSYIEGIIKKNRTVQDIQKQKEFDKCIQSEKNLQTQKKQNDSTNISETSKEPYSEKDTSEHLLAKYSSKNMTSEQLTNFFKRKGIF